MSRVRGAEVALAVAVVSAMASSTSGPFAKSLLEGGWSPGGVALARTACSTLVLLLPATWLLRGRWAAVRSSAPGIGMLGVLGIAGTVVCYFTAVSLMPVGVAMMIQYTSPVLVLAWVWARHGQRPQVVTMLGATVAMAGLVLVVGAMGVDRPPVAGVLWALGGAVCLATYFMTSDQMSAWVPPVGLAFAGLLVGTLAMGLLAVVRVLPVEMASPDVRLADTTVPVWVPLAGVVGISTVFAYVASMAAVGTLGARLASFVSLSELVSAVLLAWLLLGERPAPVQLLGGLLILGGVLLIRTDDSDRLRHAVKADESQDPFVPDPS